MNKIIGKLINLIDISDNTDIVDKLLTAGADPNTVYNKTTNATMLFAAIFNSNTVFC